MIQLAALMMLLFLLAGCAERKTEPAGGSGNKAGEIATPLKAATEVVSDPFIPVKTMLSRNCAPCHDPGGKMYEPLPFDNPQVVRSRSASILQRLNSQDDKRVMESWLAILQK